jgi:hypothetical protein
MNSIIAWVVRFKEPERKAFIISGGWGVTSLGLWAVVIPLQLC